jgi:uncharacterized RDD family membrane protein YckC
VKIRVFKGEFISDPFSNSESFAPPIRTTGTALVPVGNGARFGAYLLDGLLAIVTCGIGWLIWSIFMWQQGTTPGKKMVGLVVVDNLTGQPAAIGKMALRELVGKLLLGSITFGVTSLVSGILILVNKDRQGLWDKIAGTTVCRAAS